MISENHIECFYYVYKCQFVIVYFTKMNNKHDSYLMHVCCFLSLYMFWRRIVTSYGKPSNLKTYQDINDICLKENMFDYIWYAILIPFLGRIPYTLFSFYIHLHIYSSYVAKIVNFPITRNPMVIRFYLHSI